MNNNVKISITDQDGNIIECDILFTFDNEENNKSYIVYTNNKVDELGNLMIYANIYDPNSDDGSLEKIETEEEWALIEQLLDGIKDKKE